MISPKVKIQSERRVNDFSGWQDPDTHRRALEAFPIFRKGLTILSSFTSVRNSQQAVDILVSGRIHVAGLISHRLPLEDFQHGIELIEGGLENTHPLTERLCFIILLRLNIRLRCTCEM